MVALASVGLLPSCRTKLIEPNRRKRHQSIELIISCYTKTIAHSWYAYVHSRRVPWLHWMAVRMQCAMLTLLQFRISLRRILWFAKTRIHKKSAILRGSGHSSEEVLLYSTLKNTTLTLAWIPLGIVSTITIRCEMRFAF